MNVAIPVTPAADMSAYDRAIAALTSGRDDWARTTVAERIAVLSAIKDALMPVAAAWAETATRHKQIPSGSPLAGEEWISGPYALMGGCNALIETLSQMEGKRFLDHLPTRELVTGQLAVKVMPHSLWDRLLLSGVSAEIWMQKGVTRQNLKEHAARGYDTPPDQRRGKVALVLGAGNIAAIAPLDAFQKLFLENQVVLLKMNPVNDYLTDVLEVALRPLIARNALRIVKGDGAVGSYLCNHPDIAEIHITGAAATHDAIVWGTGAAAIANKAAGTPINTRRITSELGAVCPTIVVPGPWTPADISFQAEHIATQKMHNSGFNCIACQALIVPEGWELTEPLLAAVEKVISASEQRMAYYPGATSRLEAFASHGGKVTRIDRGRAPALVVADLRGATGSEWFAQNEVFAPALGIQSIAGSDPAVYLKAAIKHANEALEGTLGANILIHPATIRQIGRQEFEAIVAELRYGCIAINGWSGLGFLLAQVPWGAFPGHTMDHVQSGIGTVHNSFMLEKTERTVVQAPWRPFPRNLLSGEMTLLPRPPWFITNRRQHVIGRLLTSFQHRPSLLKLPRIFLNALFG